MRFTAGKRESHRGPSAGCGRLHTCRSQCLRPANLDETRSTAAAARTKGPKRHSVPLLDLDALIATLLGLRSARGGQQRNGAPVLTRPRSLPPWPPLSESHSGESHTKHRRSVLTAYAVLPRSGPPGFTAEGVPKAYPDPTAAMKAIVVAVAVLAFAALAVQVRPRRRKRTVHACCKRSAVARRRRAPVMFGSERVVRKPACFR
jgi:hypothetical protein